MLEIGRAEVSELSLSLLLLECPHCRLRMAIDQEYIDRIGGISGECPGCGESYTVGEESDVKHFFGEHTCPDHCLRLVETLYFDCSDRVIIDTEKYGLCGIHSHSWQQIPRTVAGRLVQRCIVCGVWKF